MRCRSVLTGKILAGQRKSMKTCWSRRSPERGWDWLKRTSGIPVGGTTEKERTEVRLKDLHLSAEMQHHGWQPGLSLWHQLSPHPPQDDHMSTGKQSPLQLHSSLAVNDFLSETNFICTINWVDRRLQTTVTDENKKPLSTTFPHFSTCWG